MFHLKFKSISILVTPPPFPSVAAMRTFSSVPSKQEIAQSYKGENAKLSEIDYRRINYLFINTRNY